MSAGSKCNVTNVKSTQTIQFDSSLVFDGHGASRKSGEDLVDREAVPGDRLARRRGPLIRTHSPRAGERYDATQLFYLHYIVPCPMLRRHTCVATSVRCALGSVRSRRQ